MIDVRGPKDVAVGDTVMHHTYAFRTGTTVGVVTRVTATRLTMRTAAGRTITAAYTKLVVESVGRFRSRSRRLVFRKFTARDHWLNAWPHTSRVTSAMQHGAPVSFIVLTHVLRDDPAGVATDVAALAAWLKLEPVEP